MTHHSDTPDRPASARLTTRGDMRRMARAALVIVPLLLLAGCGGSDNPAIRLLNVSQDYTYLNIYVGGSTTTPNVAAVPTGTLSTYAGISTGSQALYFTEGSNTQSDALSTETESFASGEHRTYVAYGDTGEFAEYEIDENQSAPAGGNASVEVLNTAGDAGTPLDVYLTGSGATLSGASPNFSDLAAGTATTFSSIASGTYELTVTATGNSSDVRLQVPSITLDSGEVITIIITESAGGYLVNAYLLPQQGALTAELHRLRRDRLDFAPEQRAGQLDRHLSARSRCIRCGVGDGRRRRRILTGTGPGRGRGLHAPRVPGPERHAGELADRHESPASRRRGQRAPGRCHVRTDGSHLAVREFRPRGHGRVVGRCLGIRHCSRGNHDGRGERHRHDDVPAALLAEPRGALVPGGIHAVHVRQCRIAERRAESGPIAAAGLPVGTSTA